MGERILPTGWRIFLFELVIVFIGVYLAFLLGNYQEGKKQSAEQKKVLSSLKLELELFRLQMPGFADYQENQILKWRKALARDSIIDFFDYRFVQPQYDYEVLEYAIHTQESQIVDFQLFNVLRATLAEIRRLEYAEEKMTEISLRYRPCPGEPDSQGRDCVHFPQNRFLFTRFISFAQSRAGLLRAVAKGSEASVREIDRRLPDNQRKEINTQLVKLFLDYSGQDPKSDVSLSMLRQYFPAIPVEELRSILNGLQREADPTVKMEDGPGD